jgi:UDP-3-O-[3-hydroxymyristoyl] glucosamine N-acyltransferase
MATRPSITAGELARRVQGALTGDAGYVVRTVAPLDEAGPDALSWIGSPEYMRRLASSTAGVVFIPAGCDAPAGRTSIQVADPDLALCEALAALGPPTETVPDGVDPTACVAADARVEGACIGPNVYVGPGAVVGAGSQLHPGVYVGAYATIGRDCVLWPNVVVREHCELGDRVILHASVTIGTDGFGYLQRAGRHVKIPQIGRVIVEDDVEIGANSCVDRARSGVTRIGRGTKIDNLVQIGHNVCIGAHCIIVGQCGISGSTTLGEHVILGGQVGVIDHLHIGSRVMVAAQSGVTRDIPDGQVWRGTPAAENGEYSRQAVGVRRLPKIMEQVRSLTKRIEQLESAANDRT